MEKKRQIDVFRGKLSMDASPYAVQFNNIYQPSLWLRLCMQGLPAYLHNDDQEGVLP